MDVPPFSRYGLFLQLHLDEAQRCREQRSTNFVDVLLDFAPYFAGCVDRSRWEMFSCIVG